ncbi:MAG: nucleoside monophosphate kinase [Firmicutes bacterium]|nr:nucleoside monophosphate kinase [Bacillota bacterium]
MVICLIGRMGAGKTTLAKFLCQNKGFVQVGSDMLREYISTKNPGWEEMADIMSKGENISDELFEAALAHKFKTIAAGANILWDGVHTAKRVRIFERFAPIDQAFYLDAPPEITVKRIEGRERFDSTPAVMEYRNKSFDENLPEILDELAGLVTHVDATHGIDDIKLLVLNQLI